jgi:hypothetical protein
VMGRTMGSFVIRLNASGDTIRTGRDEVLETAIRQIVGTSVPEARIEAMAKP